MLQNFPPMLSSNGQLLNMLILERANMFQTISHKPGCFIQISTFGAYSTIAAWAHGEKIGEHYKTVQGAKTAITRYHKAWLAENQAAHHKACFDKGTAK